MKCYPMTKESHEVYDRIDKALTYAEHCLENELDDEPTKPWEIERPANESNLDRWRDCEWTKVK